MLNHENPCYQHSINKFVICLLKFITTLKNEMSKLILCPDTNISPAITSSENCSCSEMIWESGHLIDPKEYDLSNLEFLCETLPSGFFPDYAVSDMGCSVISECLKNLLEKLGIDNIQYFNAKIIEQEGESAKQGYYAANIVGLVDCIDREVSEMDVEADENGELNIIFGIDKLVLKDIPSNYNTIYRVSFFTRLILVDKDLKDIFEQNFIQGIKLVKPERWDGIHGEI